MVQDGGRVRRGLWSQKKPWSLGHYSKVPETPVSQSPEHRTARVILTDSSATAGPATWISWLGYVDVARATFAWHFIMGGKKRQGACLILAVGPDGLGPKLCFLKVGQGSGAHWGSKNKAHLLLLPCGDLGGLWEHKSYGPCMSPVLFCSRSQKGPLCPAFQGARLGSKGEHSKKDKESLINRLEPR